MKNEDRFIKSYSQSGLVKGDIEVWVDSRTGVNYLYRGNGYGGGLTVLVDADGKPVVTPVKPGYDGPEL